MRNVINFGIFTFQRATLISTSFGFLLVVLDASVVNIALPQIAVEFHQGVTLLQWIVNSYTLCLASFILGGGALGDFSGARNVFMVGMAIFTVSSTLCGIASNAAWLIAARSLQGLGAALLIPTSLSLLSDAYPDPRKRAKAVGIWAAASGVGLSAGPIVGGLLLTTMGWRSIFLINMPIGIAALYLIARDSVNRRVIIHRKFDIAGQVLAIFSLFAVSATIIQTGSADRPGSVTVIGAILSVVLIAGFLRVESRHSDPMLPLVLFRSPIFSVVTVVGFSISFSFYGALFLLNLFFQTIKLYSPIAAGVAFLPMTAISVLMNIIAAHLITKTGARPILFAGLTTAALGYFLLSRLTPDSCSFYLTFSLLIAGMRVTLTIPTMATAVLSATDPQRAGIASAVLNSGRQTGGVLGVAVAGVLINGKSPIEFVGGMALFLEGVATLLSLIATLVIFGIPKSSPRARRKGGATARRKES